MVYRRTLIATGTALCLALPLGVGALPASSAVPAASIRSVSNPAMVHAVIRTIALPLDGRAVGTGPDLGDSIYIAAGTNWEGRLLQIDPVTLVETGRATVGRYPKGLAVSADDTIYVVDADDDTMSVVRGSTMTASPVAVPVAPQAVALSRPVDDTVFVSSSTRFGSPATPKLATLNADTLGSRDDTPLPASASPSGLAVASDGSVYISSYSGNKLYLFNPSTRAVSDVTTASGPIGVAISRDDTVYYSNQVGGTVKGFKSGIPGVQTSVTVDDPMGITVSHDDTVYVVGQSTRTLSVINPRTFTIDDSVLLGGSLQSVAVTRSGLVVTASAYTPTAWIIAAVTPSLTTSSAMVGATGSLAITGLPAGVTVDDTTVSSVTFGGTTAAWSRTPGTNTLTGPIPAGSGTVQVTVSFNGGNSASAGTFTYATPAPPPAPTYYPPSEPAGVVAIAGDARADVSWRAPVDPGSYPVTEYEAMSSPGSRTCTVVAPALTCQISGLGNGVPYTFRVRARNEAGWGLWSLPSGSVTPEAPPSAPRDIAAIPGNAQASVKWLAPIDSGSTAILEYEVQSDPLAGSCITAALTCDVMGLANDTPYTFRARARNTAGWGPWSSQSVPVIPRAPDPTIVITGTRGDVRGKSGVIVTGTTTHMGMGAIVHPWIRFAGQTSYTQGSATIVIGVDGAFQWERVTGRKTYVYVTTPGAGVKSNSVVVAAR